MGDWGFLHEMASEGYSESDISDAATTGVAPWQWGKVCRKRKKKELKNYRTD